MGCNDAQEDVWSTKVLLLLFCVHLKYQTTAPKMMTNELCKYTHQSIFIKHAMLCVPLGNGKTFWDIDTHIILNFIQKLFHSCFWVGTVQFVYTIIVVGQNLGCDAVTTMYSFCFNCLNIEELFDSQINIEPIRHFVTGTINDE